MVDPLRIHRGTGRPYGGMGKDLGEVAQEVEIFRRFEPTSPGNDDLGFGHDASMNDPDTTGCWPEPAFLARKISRVALSAKEAAPWRTPAAVGFPHPAPGEAKKGRFSVKIRLPPRI